MSQTEPLDPLFEEFPPTSTEEWESVIEEDLRGKDYDEMLVWDSLEGLVVQPYYRRDDLGDLAHVDLDAGVPPLSGGDELPANRWAVRQDLAHADLDEARRLARQALDRGATDLGVIAEVEGDSVRGLPLQNVDDVARFIADVDPTETPLHLSGGPAAAVLFAFLLTRMHERAADASGLRGSVHFDPVAVLAKGAMPSTPAGIERTFDLGADLARRAADLPQMRTWTVSAKPYHDAGAAIRQEVTYVLGALSESLDRFTERGVDLETAVRGMQVVVPVSTSYFPEIAKLRALRLLIPQVIDAFADAADRSIAFAPEDVRLQAVTSQRTHTTFDPYVNMLRGTTEAMAAVIGGCDVLSVAPYDATFRSQGDFSTRIARNTQLILRHESHADQVADPAAGSYYVEAVTDQLAEKAWAAFQELEASGGILQALRDGGLQSEVAHVRERRLDEVETRARVLVGTNHYPDLDETKLDQIDAEPEDATAAEGDAGAAPELPQPDTTPLRWSARPVSLDTPTLATLVDAAADGATLGDLVSALREETPGEGQNGQSSPSGEESGDEPVIEPLPSIRLSDAFERLRLRTERYSEATGQTPTVFLAPLGHPAMRSARANFARNFFGVAGFDVVENLRFESAADAVDAAVGESADAVVLCSSDAEYPDLAAEMRTAMRDRSLAALLVVAGNPDKIDADLPADDFVHLGSPLLETLQTFQERLLGEIGG